MTDFTLHPRLAADTVLVASLPLCDVLLMDDSTYPWVVLVPRRADIREMHQLGTEDQQVLMQEITHVSAQMEKLFSADKMNVAALGNMVPQLHVHIIARYETDPAWPGPIWGIVKAKPYEPDALTKRIAALKAIL